MYSRTASRPLAFHASELNEHQLPPQLHQQHRKDRAAAKTTSTGKEQTAARLDHCLGPRYHPLGIYQDHTIPGSTQEEPTLTHIMIVVVSCAEPHSSSSSSSRSSSSYNRNERYSWTHRYTPTSISRTITASVLRSETGVPQQFGYPYRCQRKQ